MGWCGNGWPPALIFNKPLAGVTRAISQLVPLTVEKPVVSETRVCIFLNSFCFVFLRQNPFDRQLRRKAKPLQENIVSVDAKKIKFVSLPKGKIS